MKKTIVTILILVFVTTFCQFNLFPFFMGNHSCRAYNNCDPEGESRGRASGPSIGQLVIQGGGYFLASNSEMLKFLNRIEMSGLNGTNNEELQEIIGHAISNLESARDIYKNIISIAKETPYDQLVILRLKLFDYQGYLEEHGLNGEVFSRVKNYLISGDVTGAYVQIKTDMEFILEQLYQIQAAVDANEFPSISLLWRVNQNYNLLSLFGLYLSEVFITL